MNCEKILFDLALRYGGNFANINDFCNVVVNQFNLKTYSDILDVLETDTFTTPDVITKDNVLINLIYNDINRYSVNSYEYLESKKLQELMVDHVDKVVSFYQSIGLSVPSDIHVFFCDSFPKPFHNNKGLALAPDSYDEMKYGIKKGIYFLKSNISSYQSRLLIAHEVLHQICSQSHPELLARGLEEGLCELIGSYIANSVLFDKPIPENYIKFRRFKYANPNQKFRIYTDYMRMAYLLFEQVGLLGIVDIINSGRQKIKTIETSLIHGDNIHISNHSNQYDTLLTKDIFNDLDRLMLGTIENEVLSPLAYYIINSYNGEKDVPSFSKAHNIKLEDCTEAFKEIQKRIYGCVIDDDRIEFSDLNQLKNNGNVLYECTSI